MSALAAAAQRFEAGEVVLIGDEHDEAIYVASPADLMTGERLEQLQQAGRGMLVLGLPGPAVDRLRLREPGDGTRRCADLTLTTPIDAAAGISGGWSTRDRALTMRVAADPGSGPHDLTVPGHVHAARIGGGRPGAATAALELARAGDHTPAVAMCAVVDPRGRPLRLRDARRDEVLRRLPLAGSAELHSRALARRTRELAAGCALPTRAGLFRALGHGSPDGADVTVALLHGDPAAASAPLVHLHVACLFGDVLRSRSCACRGELDDAVDAIVREGAGVIVYARPPASAAFRCPREERVSPTLVAGLLRAAGIDALRLAEPAGWLAAGLRSRGLAVRP